MNTLLRRRAMIAAGGGGPAPLPYTPVEYIETDGTAYLDSGIKGNYPRSVEFTVIPVSVSTQRFFFGARKDTGDTRFNFFSISSDKKANYSYGSGTYGSVNIANSINNRTPMTVRTSLKNGAQQIQVKQQGESSFTTVSSTNSASITTGLNIFIFAWNYIGNPGTIEPGLRFARTKIFSDANYSTLVFDGQPCVYNGEYGMWDLVSDTFFGNAAASGAFTGPAI